MDTLVKSQDITDALNGSTGIITEITEKNKIEIFYGLCFCLMVPQSKAVKAEIAIQELKKIDFYNNFISKEDLATLIKPHVRFHNNKARYIIEAKDKFSEIWPNLVSFYNSFIEIKNNDQKMKFLQNIRDYLIDSFNGMSMKASAHYMRNIGLRGLSILDVHILQGLQKRGVIESSKHPLTKKRYCDIEVRMLTYASSLGWTIDELDLCLWKEKTGFVFK